MNESKAIRNVKIYEMFLDGAKYIDIAGRFGVAVTTVVQIVSDARKRSKQKTERAFSTETKPCLTLEDMKQQLNLHVGQKISVDDIAYTIESLEHPDFAMCRRSNGIPETFLYKNLWMTFKSGGAK